MNIGFCVPAVFENEYATELVRLNSETSGIGRIVEVYGACPRQLVGSLRSKIRDISLDQVRDFVATVHRGNIEFNYLLNTTLLDGNEYTKEGRRKIYEYIDSLWEIGIRRFTVAVPFLVNFLCRHYREVEVVASIVAGIQSVSLAERFIDLGAKRIVVLQDVNRRLDILEGILSLDANIEVLVNSPCIHACPERVYHANLTSLETTNSLAQVYLKPREEIPTCLLHCRLSRFSHLAEVIRIPWIRPEDVKDYHRLGVTHFKLDGRIASSNYNLERISAYLRGQYEGNLLYLLMENVPRTLEEICNAPRDFYRLYIENANLDGLVSRMPCLRQEMSCRMCKFCDKAAATLVHFDKEWLKRRKIEFDQEISERYSI